MYIWILIFEHSMSKRTSRLLLTASTDVNKIDMSFKRLHGLLLKTVLSGIICLYCNMNKLVNTVWRNLSLFDNIFKVRFQSLNAPLTNQEQQLEQ